VDEKIFGGKKITVWRIYSGLDIAVNNENGIELFLNHRD